MRLRRCLAAAALLVAAAGLSAKPILRADDTWLLSTVGPMGETAVCILKVEHKDGGVGLSVVAAQPNTEAAVQDVKVAGQDITFTLKQTRKLTLADGSTRDSTATQSVALTLSEGGAAALGNMVDNRVPTPTRVKAARTDRTTLDAKGLLARGPAAELWGKLSGSKSTALFLQYQKEKDADKKKELVKEINAAQKEAQDKAPGLYREIVAKFPDAPAATDAALGLIRAARPAKLEADEAGKLVAVIRKGAEPYGPRYTRAVLGQAADALVAVKGLEKAALTAVEPVAAALTDADPAATRSRVLTTYKTALEKTGNADRAKDVAVKLEKIEAVLDAEYLKTVPPFKPAKYAGRKDKGATKVAVLELFTGAQCPPCVAADVAFDALAKSYPATDLVLIQYHMHIPGPDPLTNPSTVARWDYYRSKFPQGIRGTPSTLFNGKPDAGGGGAMANAENKYGQYAKLIDPLLEQTADVKLAGEAKRAGDTVTVTVDVSGMKEPGDKVKLRLVLVEETVKYVGSNGLRFHHQVVRDLIGGAEGVAVAKLAGGKHTATVDLAKVKAGLTEYLDDFAKSRPFPNPNRPMDLKGLKVIALVQDDDSREILQAAQFDVAGR
ncbi:MAG: hypothetical protein U0871_12545 [Gemmataceae bacterium]